MIIRLTWEKFVELVDKQLVEADMPRDIVISEIDLFLPEDDEVVVQFVEECKLWISNAT